MEFQVCKVGGQRLRRRHQRHLDLPLMKRQSNEGGEEFSYSSSEYQESYWDTVQTVPFRVLDVSRSNS